MLLEHRLAVGDIRIGRVLAGVLLRGRLVKALVPS